ncbi:hypothetical protein ACP4OV_012149 [Aristida adscensionis]
MPPEEEEVPPPPPCQACSKKSRRRCPPGCLFAYYFPPGDDAAAERYSALQMVFGERNFSKLLEKVEKLPLSPEQRREAVASLVHEVQARVDHPADGGHSNVLLIKKVFNDALSRAAAAKEELAAVAGPVAAAQAFDPAAVSPEVRKKADAQPESTLQSVTAQEIKGKRKAPSAPEMHHVVAARGGTGSPRARGVPPGFGYVYPNQQTPDAAAHQVAMGQAMVLHQFAGAQQQRHPTVQAQALAQHGGAEVGFPLQQPRPETTQRQQQMAREQAMMRQFAAAQQQMAMEQAMMWQFAAAQHAAAGLVFAVQQRPPQQQTVQQAASELALMRQFAAAQQQQQRRLLAQHAAAGQQPQQQQMVQRLAAAQQAASELALMRQAMAAQQPRLLLPAQHAAAMVGFRGFPPRPQVVGQMAAAQSSASSPQQAARGQVTAAAQQAGAMVGFRGFQPRPQIVRQMAAAQSSSSSAQQAARGKVVAAQHQNLVAGQHAGLGVGFRGEQPRPQTAAAQSSGAAAAQAARERDTMREEAATQRHTKKMKLAAKKVDGAQHNKPTAQHAAATGLNAARGLQQTTPEMAQAQQPAAATDQDALIEQLAAAQQQDTLEQYAALGFVFTATPGHGHPQQSEIDLMMQQQQPAAANAAGFQVPPPPPPSLGQRNDQVQNQQQPGSIDDEIAKYLEWVALFKSNSEKDIIV